MTAEDKAIRRDFPLLENHPEIAYLDNTATAHKPVARISTVPSASAAAAIPAARQMAKIFDMRPLYQNPSELGQHEFTSPCGFGIIFSMKNAILAILIAPCLAFAAPQASLLLYPPPAEIARTAGPGFDRETT